jgi:hypothetical protein
MNIVSAKAVKRIRRSPRFVVARRGLVTWLRRNTAMRRTAHRLFAIDSPVAVPPDVAAGRVLSGVDTESLPVVLVVVLGADKPTLVDVVDEMARLQAQNAGFRPVIVSDTEAFAEIRSTGYPVELLISRTDWDGSRPWDEYVAERLGLFFATYRPNAAVTVGPTGLDDASRLLLTSLRPQTL